MRFAQLIEEKRQERLSTIDQDAADEQARVEQLERAYLEGLEAERDQPLPGEQPVVVAEEGPVLTEDRVGPPNLPNSDER